MISIIEIFGYAFIVYVSFRLLKMVIMDECEEKFIKRDEFYKFKRDIDGNIANGKR